ncbi:MAG: FAD binding domain-containing protein [Chloroflexi bacterium]|nr:FAD binding domain-containing protein [Chloroflexota bacterium]
MANPKHYYRPTTLAEALELAQQPDTVALAGGNVVLGRLDVPFETLVDLQAIPELNQVQQEANGWYDIGAACSLQQVAGLPGLPEVMRRSLTRAIPLNQRNGTSVGESLVQPARFPEWVAALVAHDIAIHQLLPNGDTVTFAASDAIPQPSNRDLWQGIITGISIPPLEASDSLGAAYVARTPADQPIVCAAVFLRLDGSGCVETVFPALSGVSESPVTTVMLPLNGQSLTEAAISRAVDSVSGLTPVSDHNGSAEYRVAMARVLLHRALLECAARG